MFELRLWLVNEILLPSPEILQDCISAIIQAFENAGEMKVMKIKWEEIKKLQTQFNLKFP